MNIWLRVSNIIPVPFSGLSAFINQMSLGLPAVPGQVQILNITLHKPAKQLQQTILC